MDFRFVWTATRKTQKKSCHYHCCASTSHPAPSSKMFDAVESSESSDGNRIGSRAALKSSEVKQRSLITMPAICWTVALRAVVRAPRCQVLGCPKWSASKAGSSG